MEKLTTYSDILNSFGILWEVLPFYGHFRGTVYSYFQLNFYHIFKISNFFTLDWQILLCKVSKTTLDHWSKNKKAYWNLYEQDGDSVVYYADQFNSEYADYIKAMKENYLVSVEILEESSAVSFKNFLNEITASGLIVRFDSIMFNGLPKISLYNEIYSLLMNLRVKESAIQISDYLLTYSKSFEIGAFDYFERINKYENLKYTKKCNTLVMQAAMFYSLVKDSTQVPCEIIEWNQNDLAATGNFCH